VHRIRTVAALVGLAPAVALTACVDLTGLLDHRPPSIVERDGLSYQVIVTPSRYSYDAYEYRVRITNASHRTVERWLPRRLVSPRVYRDGDWSRPVWDPCEWSCGGHYRDEVRVRLRRGDAIEGWWGEVRGRDFRRHNTRVYHLVLVIDTGHHRFEVLGLPELRVY
jgi:hypothetical protein